MLHQIKIPKCEAELICVLDFIERLLEYTCVPEPITNDGIKKDFGDEISEWLLENDASSNVLQKLKEFATYGVEEKLLVLERFRHDRKFINSLNDPTFIFQLRSGIKTDPLRVWLNGFYSQFSKGFPEFVRQRPGYFSSRDWWDSFWEKNPNQLVCSFCDGTLSHKRTIDHYFSKFIYPALSVHPSNLIPMCEGCNNGKDKVDVLDGKNFLNIFVPYRDSIDEEIDLTFTPNPAGKDQFSIVIIGSDNRLPEKVQHYSTLFDIPTKWNKNFSEVITPAISMLRSHVRLMRKFGVPITRNNFANCIENISLDMQKDWGKIPFYYPATKWLAWAKDNKFDYLCEECGVSS